MSRRRPTPSSVVDAAARYRGAAGQAYHRKVHGRLLTDARAVEATAALARHRYFQNLDPSTKVLEYGAGTGANLHELPVLERAAFDVSETALDACRELGLIAYDNEDEIPNDHYGFVLCRHVLEHLSDPGRALNVMRSKLVPGGQLLVIVPVERSNRRFRRIPAPDVHLHLHAWNVKHLSNLLYVTGFRPVRHAYFWYSMQMKLRILRVLAGGRVYSTAVSLAGRLRRQCELAMWAERLR